MKKLIISLTLFTLLFLLVGCTNDKQGGYIDSPYVNQYEGENEHQEIIEQPFINTEVNNKSNISLSANTAAYSFIRSQILNGMSVNKNAVRVEEMVNFFDYNYNQPINNDVFGFKAEVFQTPWNEETNILLVGLETKKVDLGNVPNNLVLLVDVSGSMSATNKLSLVKQSMKLLVEQMNEDDLISLVTYSGKEKIIFKGKSANDLEEINKKINGLSAWGGTNGKKGLKMAYEVASELFIDDGNNRIILATDGDFNLGMSSTDELVEYISSKRESGIYFSAFGFGYGNYKDEKLERLAMAGNGVYHYIDDILTARKAFIDNIDGLLYTVARDAKAQIIFNSNSVLEFRLIGYENRTLSNEQFEDDQTDAGEIGTGLQVTAIYEVKLSDNISEDFASLEIKYKDHVINNDEVYNNSFIISNNVLTDTPNDDSLFISCVLEFGLILLNSNYLGTANLNSIIERLESNDYNKYDYYRNDFIELVKKYQKIIA